MSNAYLVDEIRNAAGEPLIAAQGSGTKARAIRTAEDVVIAKGVFRILGATETMQPTKKP